MTVAGPPTDRERATRGLAGRIALTGLVVVPTALACTALVFAALFSCFKQAPQECAAAQAAWSWAVVAAAVAGTSLVIVVWASASRLRWLVRGAAAVAVPLVLAGYFAWQAAGVVQARVPVTVTEVTGGGERQTVCWSAADGPPPVEAGCHDAYGGFDIAAGSQVELSLRRNSRTGPWEILSIWPR